MNLLKKIKEKPIIEYIIVTILFVAASISFASSTGILNSGFHFTDDHEIIDINNQIINNGFFKTLSFFIVDDLVWRYRPLFFVVRVLRALLIKNNFFLWHLIVAIECGLYVAFSYILARKMNTKVIPSLLFSFIYLLGSQDEVVWRMGTQENMGLFFLSLSLLLTYCYYEKNSKVYGTLAAISTILMGLCKEAFLLLIPTVILFLFYLYVHNNDEDINIFKKALSFIKKYKWFIISTCASLLFGVALIFFYVGLMQPGYAGVDTSYTVGEYIRITLNVFLRDLTDYWYLFGLMILVAVISIVSNTVEKKLTRKYWESLLVGFALFAYSMVIEAFLHAKSAMFDRYKLPLVWLLFFALIVLLNDYINKWIHYAIAVGACIFMIISCNVHDHNIIDDGKYYAIDGKRVTSMLNRVGELSKDNQDYIVLTDLYWYEQDLSSSIYLQIEKGISEVFYLDPEREDGDYKKIFNKGQKRIGMQDADIIITDPIRIEEHIIDGYDVEDYSSYKLLIKK